MVDIEKLEKISDRFDNLGAQLLNCGHNHQIAEMSREYKKLAPLAERIREYRKLCADITETEMLLEDPELRLLAEKELVALRSKHQESERELLVALLPDDADDDRSAIIEIRAGTGGNEAALFSGDLYRIYQRYSALKGWEFERIGFSATMLGGYREVSANVQGKGAFAKLKFESGVHRVQRVPTTESGGRIHTSAATVAVLPEAQEVDIQILPNDIRTDTMRASGSGGQHVNTTDSAVRITHLPTGITVISSEKSQHQNRATAMKVLRSRLYDLQRNKDQAERAADRKSQVGSGDRSERIRTYNFQQGRITDHRIGLTIFDIEGVLNGELDTLIDALTANDQAVRIAEFGQ